MGCMFGRETYDDDEQYYDHHDRSHRRVVPQDNYCLLCGCQQYTQRYRDSNRCFCGHRPGEHKRI